MYRIQQRSSPSNISEKNNDFAKTLAVVEVEFFNLFYLIPKQDKSKLGKLDFVVYFSHMSVLVNRLCAVTDQSWWRQWFFWQVIQMITSQEGWRNEIDGKGSHKVTAKYRAVNLIWKKEEVCHEIAQIKRQWYVSKAEEFWVTVWQKSEDLTGFLCICLTVHWA